MTFSPRPACRVAAACAALLLLLSTGGLLHAQQQTSLAATEQKSLYYDAVKARMNGRDDEAEKLLRQFVKTSPGVAAAWYDLARIEIKNNRQDQAAQDMQQAISLDKTNNKFYREEYANILYAQRRYAQAAEVYAALARDEERNDEYLYKASVLYQRDEKFAEAMQQLELLDKRRPNDEDVLNEKQKLYLRMNDVESAARVIRQMIALDPKSPQYYSLLADVYTSNKEEQKAAEVITEMQRLFPDEPMVQLTIGTQYLKKGDTAKYREYVRRAITNKDLDVDSKLSLLVSYAQQAGADDTASRADLLQIAGDIAAQHPGDVKVATVYAEVLSMNGRAKDAADQYKKAVAADPSKFDSWQQLLSSYTAREDADSLIFYSEKAIRLFPNQALAHFFAGVGYLNKKQNDKAIKAIQRGIDFQPEENTGLLATMYTTLGDAYNAAKRFSSSDSAYDAALKLDPKNATLLNNYAYYLSVRKVRLDDAAKMSQQSLVIRPGESTFLDTYGWILYQQGKFADAKKYINDALKANPDADGTLYEHLGDVEYRLGNKDEAVKEWQRAKLKGTDNPDIDKKISERKIPD